MKILKTAVGDIIAMSPSDKMQFMTNTIAKMTNKPVYANPLIALTGTNGTSMTELIAAFGEAEASKNQALIKPALAAFNKAIRRQCLFIDVVADGSETIITDAGFIATSADIVAAIALAKPAAPVLTHGAVGCIKKTSTTLKGAKSYLSIITSNGSLPIDISGDCIAITPAAGDKILIDSRTSTKATYSGLPSGTRMYVTTFGFNKLGKSPASDKIDIMVP